MERPGRERERTELVACRFTPEELKLIEFQAGKLKFTVSEYVRTACIMALIMDGNLKALKLVTRDAARRLAGRLAVFAGKPVAG